jgi:hypothetical protein
MTDKTINTVEDIDQNGTQVGIKALQISEVALDQFQSAADVGSAIGKAVIQGLISFNIRFCSGTKFVTI